MANPHNPIDHYGVNESGGVGGAEIWERERRVQTLLAKWMGLYFTGVSFEVDDGKSGVNEVTLPECVFLFGQDRWPQDGGKPVIHWQQSDERGKSEWKREGVNTRKEKLVWNVVVRVAPQTAENGSDDHLCRKVAGGLKWLLTGDERQGLSEKGIGHVEVVRGPVLVASSPAFVRQLVVSMEVWEDRASNIL